MEAVATYDGDLQAKSKLNPDFTTTIFKDWSVSYNLRKRFDTLLPAVRTITYGMKTVRFIRNKLLQVLPLSLKTIPNLANFKKDIRSWISKSRGCGICKNFIDNLGFV